MTKSQRTIRKAILTHQILRLARLYTAKKVCGANLYWHNRIGELQSQLIMEKKILSGVPAVELAARYNNLKPFNTI